MPKTLLQLRKEGAYELYSQTEAGMGFYLLEVQLPNATGQQLVVVGGDNYVVPIGELGDVVDCVGKL